MKTMKKLAALALCLTLAAVNSVSVFAADSYTWSFAATPKYSEIPRSTNLDYCAKGYTAKITSKSGNSSANFVTIESNAHADIKGQYSTVATPSDVNVAKNILPPKHNVGTVTFRITLTWDQGCTVNNKGIIARK